MDSQDDFGQVLCEVLEEIGNDIDFLILDPEHCFLGELFEVRLVIKTAKHLVKRHVFPKMLRNQRQDWVVIPENEMYYR